MVKNLASRSIGFAVQYQKVFFALLAIAFGVGIGLAATHSRESLETLMSALAMGLFALIALYHPLGAFVCWFFLNTFIDSWVEIELGHGIPDISFGRFAIFALLTSYFMRVSTGSVRLIPMNASDFFAILTPFAIALSAPLSVQPLATVQTALSLYFIPMAAFILAKQLIRNKEHLHLFLTVVAVFGAIAGAHTLYEALTGNMIFMAKGQELSRLYRGETGLRLIEGLVGETGSMGRVLAMTLLTTLYLIAESKNSYFKPYWMVGALLQFGGLIATFSRTPILTFLVGLLILQFVYPGLRRLLIILVIVVSGVLAVKWQDIQQTEAAQERFSNINTAHGRSGRWAAGLNMWLERPVRGWGMGRYGELSGRFRADGSRQNIDAVENDYLLILVGSGLIGFLPYALFLLTTALSSLRLFLRRKTLEADGGFIHSGTIVLAWVIIICFVVSSFTAINAFAVSRILPFALIGAIVGTHQPRLVRKAPEVVEPAHSGGKQWAKRATMTLNN